VNVAFAEGPRRAAAIISRGRRCERAAAAFGPRDRPGNVARWLFLQY
jgi:hypothetical protein